LTTSRRSASALIHAAAFGVDVAWHWSIEATVDGVPAGRFTLSNRQQSGINAH
jgi:hypothetical protein